MASFWIHGAGAVGSALAAYLSRAGHKVGLTAREPHARAVAAAGLRASSYDESFTVHPEARSTLPRTLSPDTWLFLTVQTQDVPAALRQMAPLAAHCPVVTFQNGVESESLAAAVCPDLTGGIIRFTATVLEPGEVRVRRPGQIILGRYPRGRDAAVDGLAGMLGDAGFEAAATPDIQSEKALKLLVNLVSGPAVLIRRRGREAALAAVQVALLTEAQAVYAASGIRAEPVSGLGLPLETMIEHFRRGGSAPDGRPVYNSTWQNLHHRRRSLENRYYHGEIMRLGHKAGIPTPVNQRTLELLEEALEHDLGPEPYEPEEFKNCFRGIVNFDAVRVEDQGKEGKLEI